MGVRCVGLLGVLVEAKRKGLVDEIRSLLDALRDIAGFWVSEALYRRVIQNEGEAL